MGTTKLNASFNFHTGVTNDQHYSVHKQIIGGLSVEEARTYYYEEALLAYIGEFDIEKLVYRPNKAFLETPEIVKRDAKRDRDFAYIVMMTDAGQFSPDEAVVEAWRKAVFAVDPYRGAARLEYTANTGRIDGFLAMAESPEFAPAFETLGLTAAIQQLRADQQAFVEVYHARDKEITVRVTSETMRTIRPKVDKRAHYLFEVLNALILANSLMTKDAAMEAHLSAVILFIQERFNSLTRVLKRRGSGDETPAPPPATGGGDDYDYGGSLVG